MRYFRFKQWEEIGISDEEKLDILDETCDKCKHAWLFEQNIFVQWGFDLTNYRTKYHS